MKHALFVIVSGFDPQDPRRLGEFSMAAARQALAFYREKKAQGHEVVVPLINTRVWARGQNGKRFMLREVVHREFLTLGFDAHDVFVLEDVRTTGSPTDGLAIASFSQEEPETEIHMFATAREVQEHLDEMYHAVAFHVMNHFFRRYNSHYPPDGPIPDQRTVLRHLQIKRATRWAAQWRWTFLLYYHLLNLIYWLRVVRGFTTTVTG